MAEGWRYVAVRLTGGDCPNDEFLDLNLPLTDVSITNALSGPGGLEATITPEVARLIAHDGPIFKPWQTAIFAEENGSIRGGGILQSPLTREGPSLRLSCAGYTAYPKDMPFTDPDGYIGINVDPIDVVRVIWDHLQSQPGGDLHLQLDRETMAGFQIGGELLVATFDPLDDPDHGPTSFEVGPVLLRIYETFDLGGEIDKYAEQTPFDFIERHWWSGDEIKHRLDFGYPRIGRRRTDLRFVYGENIFVAPSIESDEYATDVLAFGAGEGRTKLRSLETKRSKYQLRRVAVVTNENAKSQRDVNALAKAELAWRTGKDDVTSLTMRDHHHAPIGALELGDEILIQGKTGWKDLNMWVRVTSITISPDDAESIQLDVVRSGKMAS